MSDYPRKRATDVALIAAFAALTAVCAIIPGIPVGGGLVPITLQTFAVLLCGAVLGPARGFLAVLLYLAVGAIGLPIFANGGSGWATLTGPTAGYLLSFPVAAGVTGLVLLALPRRGALAAAWVFLACAVGIVVSHLAGVWGLHVRADLGWHAAFVVDGPFWAVDAIKAVFVAIVASAVYRAFPRLFHW